MVSTCAGVRAFMWPAPARARRSSSRFQSWRRMVTNSSARMRDDNKPPMSQPLPDSDLVVATPERVSFDYQVAGLATRGIAQLLDLLILSFFLAALYAAAIFVGAAGSDVLAYLIAVIGTFVIVFGYHWTCEAFWSGQTVGKRVFRLRAVGDRGEPMTFAQAGIRNLVRLVDFLPYGYGMAWSCCSSTDAARGLATSRRARSWSRTRTGCRCGRCRAAGRRTPDHRRRRGERLRRRRPRWPTRPHRRLSSFCVGSTQICGAWSPPTGGAGRSCLTR